MDRPAVNPSSHTVIFLCTGTGPGDPGVTSRSGCCLWLWGVERLRGVESVVQMYLNPGLFKKSASLSLNFLFINIMEKSTELKDSH